MIELKLKIKDSDFSTFAGYRYTDSSQKENNEVLDAYIQLFKSNDQIKYFQIDCDATFPIHTIAYIIENVKEKYFIRTNFHDADSSKNGYTLCFHKEEEQE